MNAYTYQDNDNNNNNNDNDNNNNNPGVEMLREEKCFEFVFEKEESSRVSDV